MKVLLTGSSKGIGYKIAKDLLAEGHELALHYNKNESTLEALLEKDSTGSFSIQADLSKQDEIKKLVVPKLFAQPQQNLEKLRKTIHPQH